MDLASSSSLIFLSVAVAMLAILDCLPTFYYVTFIAPLTMFFDMLMRCYSITDVILMPYSKCHIAQRAAHTMV